MAGRDGRRWDRKRRRAVLAVAALATALADRYPETNRGTLTDSDEARRMTVVAYSRLDPSARKQVILISVVVFGATGMLLAQLGEERAAARIDAGIRFACTKLASMRAGEMGYSTLEVGDLVVEAAAV